MRAGTPEEWNTLTGTRDGVNDIEITCTPENSRWKVSNDRLPLMKVQRPFVAKNLGGVSAEDRLGGRTRADGVRAVCEAHPAVAFQQDRMLHVSRWNNASPYRELSRRGIATQKLDAEPDGG